MPGKARLIFVVLCLLGFIVYVNSRESYRDISVDALIQEIDDKVDFDKFEKYENAEIKQIWGINPNEYDSVAYYGHHSVMECDKILIIRLKDKSQSENILNIIEKKNSSDKDLFKNYAPEQYKILSDSVIKQVDMYVFYIVDPDVKNIESQIMKTITE